MASVPVTEPKIEPDLYTIPPACQANKLKPDIGEPVLSTVSNPDKRIHMG